MNRVGPHSSNRQIKSILLIVFPGILLASCVTLYKPNAIHSPLLQEKGQLNTSAMVGFSGNGLYNVQAAYAISDHLGIMADGMYHNRQSSDASTKEKLHMTFGEAGLGYFKKIGSNENILFQCYGGGGGGVTTDKIVNGTQPNPEINVDYYNLFFQPGVALLNKNLELAFDLRTNYVNLQNVHAYLYNEFEWWNTDFKYYSDTSFYFVNLEPTFTMKAGGEKLKGLLQVGMTVPTINSESYFLANTSSRMGFPLIKFSIGISYRFGKRQFP